FRRRALARVLGTTGRSANLGAMAVARHPALLSLLTRESPKAFPSSSTYPSPGMPRSPTPAASPAQSPEPTPTGAFPNWNTVGHCTISVMGRDRFTLVAACRSLCLRFVMFVALHDAKLDCRWLAGPWRRRSRTSWIDEASSGRTPISSKKVHVEKHV